MIRHSSKARAWTEFQSIGKSSFNRVHVAHLTGPSVSGPCRVDEVPIVKSPTQMTIVTINLHTATITPDLPAPQDYDMPRTIVKYSPGCTVALWPWVSHVVHGPSSLALSSDLLPGHHELSCSAQPPSSTMTLLTWSQLIIHSCSTSQHTCISVPNTSGVHTCKLRETALQDDVPHGPTGCTPPGAGWIE